MWAKKRREVVTASNYILLSLFFSLSQSKQASPARVAKYLLTLPIDTFPLGVNRSLRREGCWSLEVLNVLDVPRVIVVPSFLKLPACLVGSSR